MSSPLAFTYAGIPYNESNVIISEGLMLFLLINQRFIILRPLYFAFAAFDDYMLTK